MITYREALTATDARNMPLVEKGSDIEKQAIENVIDIFTHFKPKQLRGVVTEHYAPDAYFRDTFTALNRADEIEEYFVRSANAVDDCSFDTQDVAESNGNYYFRWAMSLRLARHKDQPADVTVGMSHIRFNREGKVVFHQDYWDAANLYEKYPVVGGTIRWTKKQIEGRE